MPLCTATAENIDALGERNVQFRYITVEDIFHIPTFHASLLSVIQFDRRGIKTTLRSNIVRIQTTPKGNIVTTGQQIRKSYELVNETNNSDIYTSDVSASDDVNNTKSNTAALWHRRLAYLHRAVRSL